MRVEVRGEEAIKIKYDFKIDGAYNEAMVYNLSVGSDDSLFCVGDTENPDDPYRQVE